VHPEGTVGRGLAGTSGPSEHVGTDDLAEAAWPENGPNEGALRVHLTRLRRRLEALSLNVQNVRGRGYLMERARRPGQARSSRH